MTELLTNPAFYAFEAFTLAVALAVVFIVRAKPALKDLAAKARVTVAELEVEAKQAIAVAKADAIEVKAFIEEAQEAAQSPEQIEAPTKVIVEGLLNPTASVPQVSADLAVQIRGLSGAPPVLVAPVSPVGGVVSQATTFDPTNSPVASTQLLSPSASPLDQSHADAPSPGNLPPLGALGLPVAPVAPASPPNSTAA